MNSPLLILFAKAPIPGRVKTRLCPPLTSTEAAELHSALVKDTTSMLLSLAAPVDIEISTDLPTKAWPEIPVLRSIQPEGDLGMRLLCALERGLAAGREKVVIVGGDSPGLPPSHVTALLASKADVALGPTCDGGFFAIACRTASRNMFERVRWSSERTFDDVVAAASACGLTIESGPAWFDVDVKKDLLRMLEMADVPVNAAEWIAKHRHLTKVLLH